MIDEKWIKKNKKFKNEEYMIFCLRMDKDHPNYLEYSYIVMSAFRTLSSLCQEQFNGQEIAQQILCVPDKD